jgi:hypothetical protein
MNIPKVGQLVYLIPEFARFYNNQIALVIEYNPYCNDMLVLINDQKIRILPEDTYEYRKVI